jgi:hypothetical protein
MDVLVVDCPSLILLAANSIPAIAEYYDKKHQVFETAVVNHAV